jgi:hypothetical protein
MKQSGAIAVELAACRAKTAPGPEFLHFRPAIARLVAFQWPLPL